MDLDGKLVFKITLGEDIRRIVIHRDEITVDELSIMLLRIFKDKIDDSDEMLIKYRDEDGDLITIADDDDMSLAIESFKVVKLVVFVNDKPKPFTSDQIKLVRKEVIALRDRANQLLDWLEPKEDVTSTNIIDEPRLNETREAGDGAREFDPLQTQVVPATTTSAQSATTNVTTSDVKPGFPPTSSQADVNGNANSSPAPMYSMPPSSMPPSSSMQALKPQAAAPTPPPQQPPQQYYGQPPQPQQGYQQWQPPPSGGPPPQPGMPPRMGAPPMPMMHGQGGPPPMMPPQGGHGHYPGFPPPSPGQQAQHPPQHGYPPPRQPHPPMPPSTDPMTNQYARPPQWN